MRVKLLKMAFHMAGTMFGKSHATFSGLTVSVVYTHQRASPKHCTYHISPVNPLFDLDKIATEIISAAKSSSDPS